MGRTILKIKDYYLEYSSIVDAPIVGGMKLEDFKKYYKEEFGNSGYKNLQERLRLTDKYGSSCGESAEEVIQGNRAGKNESCISLDEMYYAYCLGEPIQDCWLPE